MNSWWVLTAVLLCAGTVAVVLALRELLADAATVLDADRGVDAATRPLPTMCDDSRLAVERIADIGDVARHPVRLATGARRSHPWRSLARRHRAVRNPAGAEAP